MPRPIETAPCDGTLIRFWCRSEAEPIVGYWSRRFFGWCSYVEDEPLVRHSVTGWKPIEDHATARAVPLQKVRRRNRKPALVVGR